MMRVMPFGDKSFRYRELGENPGRRGSTKMGLKTQNGTRFKRIREWPAPNFETAIELRTAHSRLVL